jgi:hypothetical protein
MPEGGPYWSQANKDLLKKWIEEGAKNTIGCASCDTSKFTYSAGVKPILDKNCVGCHQTATPSNRNVKLSDYDGVKATVTSGKLLPSINQTGPFPMPQPPSTKLNSCNLTVITKWVNAGAPNN